MTATGPASGAAPRPEIHDPPMPFMEHLRELRKRIFHAVIGIAAGFSVAYWYSRELFALLMRPLRYAIHTVKAQGFLPNYDPAQLSFKSPTEPFFTFLQTGLLGGFILAAPWVLFQLWKFIAPALYKKEKVIAVPFVFFATLFFAGGVYFCWAVVLPYGFTYLIQYGLGVEDPAIAVHPTPMIMMTEYFDLSSRLLLAFGAIFEFPLVIAFMAALGVVTHKTLLHYQRYAVIFLAILSAVLTPTPDPVTMLLMLVPLVALYYGSVGVAYLFARRRARAEAAERSSDPADPAEPA